MGEARMRLVHGLVAAALSITTLAVAPPSVAEEAPSPSPPAGRAAPPQPADPERAAAARARRDGLPVEVEALRSETRTVFAQPDGTMKMELNVRPVRVRKDDRWVPVDTTLHLRPDGAVEPVAAAVGLTFSGGGDSALARLSRGGKSMELGWTGPLPTPHAERRHRHLRRGQARRGPPGHRRRGRLLPRAGRQVAGRGREPDRAGVPARRTRAGAGNRRGRQPGGDRRQRRHAVHRADPPRCGTRRACPTRRRSRRAAHPRPARPSWTWS
ncbi:hypothetical protein [Nonomuraea salmonea]|uniref:hypothetical protein n=1 Tax=Nonomuraea salmonea TaxID=46181 RepID=UPI0031E9C573